MILHHLSLSRVSLLCVLIATHAAFADIASTNYVANNYVPNTTGVTHTANTAVGDATQPVYIASDGKATATTYTLGASVPSNADFSDTKVTQSAVTTSAAYPILFAPSASPTSGTATTAGYGSGITINPSTKTITATTFNGKNITLNGTSTSRGTETFGAYTDTTFANGSTATFNGTVTVPTPTADTHAATKKYVDDAIGALPADEDTTYTAGTGIDITNEEISVKVGDRLGVASDGTLSVNYIDTLKKIGTDTSYKTHNKVVTAQAFLNGWHRTPSAAQVKSLLESTSTDKENTIPSMSAAKTIAEYVIGNPTTGDADEVLTVNASGKVTPAKITTANFDVYDSGNNPDGALTTSIQYDPTNESDARIPTAKAVAKAAQNATQLFYMNYVTPTMVWHDANTAVGSATQPVYIASNGEPTATTYTLGASVPSNADFSDTKVTQSVSTANNKYPLLATPTANATTNQGEKTSIFGSGVTVNPSTSTVYATTFDGKNLTLNGTSTSRGTETFGAYTDTTFASGSTATFNGTVTVPTPTADTHAANKGYVDSKVSTAIAAIPTPTDNDTKNTTGATTQTTATKLFLVGSVGQTAEEETHTNSNAYVDTAGAVNSVTPASGDASTKTATTKWVSDYYQPKGSYLTSYTETDPLSLHTAQGTTNAKKVISTSSTGAVGPHSITGSGSVSVTVADSGDITIAGTTYSLSGLGGVPTTRTVNGKALSSDITLSASDVALSGYSRPVSYDALGDGDTVTAALGKLEAGLWEDRERITATESQDKIDGVTANGKITNRYGVSATAAATAAKTVSITKGTFSLETGARVTVKFTNANTAASPTLNVNGTGAKNVYHGGAQITTGANKALLAGVCDFVYDGTGWALVGNYYDSTITGGASTIATSDLTANRALVSNASGKVAVSAVTATELGYLSGLTSNAQTQITNALKQVCVTSNCSSTATMYIE